MAKRGHELRFYPVYLWLFAFVINVTWGSLVACRDNLCINMSILSGVFEVIERTADIMDYLWSTYLAMETRLQWGHCTSKCDWINDNLVQV